MLSFSAPVAIILGLVAAAKGGRKWVVIMIELIALPLFLVGCASAVSV
jgi:nitrate/nitrite transporter NarK